MIWCLPRINNKPLRRRNLVDVQPKPWVWAQAVETAHLEARPDHPLGEAERVHPHHHPVEMEVAVVEECLNLRVLALTTSCKPVSIISGSLEHELTKTEVICDLYIVYYLNGC